MCNRELSPRYSDRASFLFRFHSHIYSQDVNLTHRIIDDLTFLFFFFFFFFFFRMSRVTISIENVYDVFKNTNIRDNVRNESLRIFESNLISSKSDSNICSRARTTRLILKRFETHIIWTVKTMKLSVCIV